MTFKVVPSGLTVTVAGPLVLKASVLPLAVTVDWAKPLIPNRRVPFVLVKVLMYSRLTAIWATTVPTEGPQSGRPTSVGVGRGVRPGLPAASPPAELR